MITVLTTNGKLVANNVRKYICDTASDIDNLPSSSAGSSAYVVETGATYMSNSVGEWIMQPVGGSGSGGAISYTLASASEINAIGVR